MRFVCGFLRREHKGCLTCGALVTGGCAFAGKASLELSFAGFYRPMM